MACCQHPAHTPCSRSGTYGCLPHVLDWAHRHCRCPSHRSGHTLQQKAEWEKKTAVMRWTRPLVGDGRCTQTKARTPTPCCAICVETTRVYQAGKLVPSNHSDWNGDNGRIGRSVVLSITQIATPRIPVLRQECEYVAPWVHVVSSQACPIARTPSTKRSRCCPKRRGVRCLQMYGRLGRGQEHRMYPVHRSLGSRPPHRYRPFAAAGRNRCAAKHRGHATCRHGGICTALQPPPASTLTPSTSRDSQHLHRM